MSERRTMASGDVLADRYELQDLVTERLGSVTWRANDSILNRNVGIEMIPSADPRADHFIEAARLSTTVTDPRFLRVLDLIEDDHGQHLVVREWARAFPLDQLLAQSPLPSARAARVMTEVAEAVAHAHEHGVYHRRLTPHHVLLKQSGAVRVVGLGVASALAPAGHHDTIDDLQAYERLDVESLGKLLYACLVSRWPGAHIDQLRAAPTEHGRLLRPRQVRAGVSRELDAVCDRILGDPPAHHRPPLTTADDVARALHLFGDESIQNDGPTTFTRVSPDLLRLDPVVVPQGPPPGLAPPRRRPKAYEPAPPTPFERGKAKALDAAKGDRRYVLAGIAVVLLLASVLGYLVSRSTGTGDDDGGPDGPAAAVQPLKVAAVNDFDPQGEDAAENPDEVGFVVDGDVRTSWSTTTYFGQADLGGLKTGVGVVLDLGGPRELSSLRVRLAGGPTDVSVYASSPGASEPRNLKGLRRVAELDAAGPDATVTMPTGFFTRYVVVWLTELPEVEPDNFRGEIREITLEGRP